jgi:hypothetical protein
VAPSLNPAPPVIVAAGPPALPFVPARAAAVMPAMTKAGGIVVMPDLRGLTLRDALRKANALGVFMSAAGDGMVSWQSPAPGEPVSYGTTGTLRLRREPDVNGGDR